MKIKLPDDNYELPQCPHGLRDGQGKIRKAGSVDCWNCYYCEYIKNNTVECSKGDGA